MFIKYVIIVLCTVCIVVVRSDTVYTFDNSQGYGRQFDGIGGISGGGATSKLLVNYPEEQRSQILDYLFKPQFGASFQILKVEIGGDSQSTDGSEASHMHHSWDENYERGYEWWLMVEAKKRNPNIKLYALPWAFPGWIGNGTRSPYSYPEQTATYIIKWILGAKAHYNLTIDYVGIWNEKYYNVPYILTLRSMLDRFGLKHVQIVAADGGWSIANDILTNTALASAISYIGVHYPDTLSSKPAIKTGKQLWASEDSVMGVDGQCWARILNHNYVNGYITGTICWSIIIAYYVGLPDHGKGIMDASQPWSGHYNINPQLWFTAHTTQFTEIGWKYLRHGAGVGKLNKGGSYVGLISPDDKDLTIIIETFDTSYTTCGNPYPSYNVSDQNITLNFSGILRNIKQLNVWYSKPSSAKSEAVMFVKEKPLMITNGLADINLQVDAIWTLTTLTTGSKGDYPTPPSSQPFPLPFSEDFESYNPGMEPFNLVPQTGSFETVKTTDKNHTNILQQTVIQEPLEWCPINLDFPVAVIGNFSWTDLYIECDVRIGNVNNTDGAFIALRINKFGCNTFEADGIYFFVFPSSKSVKLSKDLAQTQVVYTGSYNGYKEWNTLSLSVHDNKATAMINGQTVVTQNITGAVKQGFAGLGTSKFGLANFDNLKIMTYSDGVNRMKHLSQRTLIKK